ncbi:Hsp20/alpha crystallin family protein, partial [Breznakia sp. OttesenSCG-928-G09]|nr:Hsp20/alpha crystallin family protein [Breznakia sp. OttesenSCG-928-G09]
MKFLPSFNVFDDVFDDAFRGSFFSKPATNMKTDISEKDGNYFLNMELAGYDKDDIKIALKDGYLTVTATKKMNDEKKDDEGNVIRQERYSGTCSRSFYVSDAVKEDDIKAKFENGELKITVPKADKKEIETNKYIS